MLEGSDSSSGSKAQALPEGKRIPFNSKRLPAAYLKQVGEALKLPISGSREELRQLVEGKLVTERGVEVSSVQVVVHDSSGSYESVVGRLRGSGSRDHLHERARYPRD